MARIKLQYKKIIDVLRTLHKKHPTYNIGRHISTAFDGYGDLWNVTDEEFLLALERYEIQQDLDITHENDKEDIDQIIHDGLNLDEILKKKVDKDYKDYKDWHY